MLNGDDFKPVTPKPPSPLYAQVIGWALALGIIACVVLGVIALARVVLGG